MGYLIVAKPYVIEKYKSGYTLRPMFRWYCKDNPLIGDFAETKAAAQAACRGGIGMNLPTSVVGVDSDIRSFDSMDRCFCANQATLKSSSEDFKILLP